MVLGNVRCGSYMEESDGYIADVSLVWGRSGVLVVASWHLFYGGVKCSYVPLLLFYRARLLQWGSMHFKSTVDPFHC